MLKEDKNYQSNNWHDFQLKNTASDHLDISVTVLRHVCVCPGDCSYKTITPEVLLYYVYGRCS